MRRGRFLRRLIVPVAVLMLAPAAGAATPAEIYRDLADNGQLDGKYSRADLQKAGKSPAVQGYGGAVPKQRLTPRVEDKLGQDAQRSFLPFTGLDLAVAAFGGLFLLMAGVSLRRVARARQQK